MGRTASWRGFSDFTFGYLLFHRSNVFFYRLDLVFMKKIVLDLVDRNWDGDVSFLPFRFPWREGEVGFIFSETPCEYYGQLQQAMW